jgi:hypothetical protein
MYLFELKNSITLIGGQRVSLRRGREAVKSKNIL